MFLSILKNGKCDPLSCKETNPPKRLNKIPKQLPSEIVKTKHAQSPPKKQLLPKNMTTLKYPPVNYHNNGKSTMFQKKKYIFRKVHLYCQVRLPEGFNPSVCSSKKNIRQGQPGALNSPYGHLKLGWQLSQGLMDQWIAAVVPNTWNKLWAIQRCFFLKFISVLHECCCICTESLYVG